jgi:hypothetical protein
MRTTSFLSAVTHTQRACELCAAAALFVIGCGGSEFQSTDSRSNVTADGGDAQGGSSSAAGGTTGAGGRGAGAAVNGGAASTGGGRSAGGNTASAGSGGVDPSGGATGAGGSTDDSDAGGDPGGTTSTGGTTGTGGQENSGGATACTVPTTFYPDTDQDSFGRSTGTILACAAPTSGNWSAVGGDCDDDAKLVFPKETTYFEAWYLNAAGNKSFDYDCSGVEEGAPSQLGAAPACASLSLGCSGTGYAPTTRSGPGVNQLCGSTTQVTCKPSGLSCAPVITTVAAYRCK